MSSSRLPSAKASIRAAGEFAGRWRGQTVVCLASGPSLTADDVEAVRLSGHPAIVVNCTFRAAPWAQVLYGMDRSFWQHYLPEIERTFAGTRVGVHLMPARYRCAAMKGVAGFRPYNNSGAGAISLAQYGGATRILMLGYDLQHTGGRAHHHEDHPRPLGNARATSVDRWVVRFAELRTRLDTAGVEYWNCTRETALDWPRMTIEEALRA
ncbi:MAG: hypothetical protein KBG29_18780 [Pseudomonadales bacterium]|nr:hypothetical protein [Pseudomonadales bacterium]